MAKVCAKQLKARVAKEVAYRSISEKQAIQDPDAVSSFEKFTGQNRADIARTTYDQDVFDDSVHACGLARNGIRFRYVGLQGPAPNNDEKGKKPRQQHHATRHLAESEHVRIEQNFKQKRQTHRIDDHQKLITALVGAGVSVKTKQGKNYDPEKHREEDILQIESLKGLLDAFEVGSLPPKDVIPHEISGESEEQGCTEGN